MPVQLIERLLADFDARPLPQLVPRDLRLSMLPGKADTLIGMRRTGKTYAMFGVMQGLLEAGLPKSHLLYLNLEDDRLGAPSIALLDSALETFYRRTPTARIERAYLFFDEVQVVDGWERFVRRVLDTEQVQVVLTGSSAKLLSTEVASSLRGRGMAIEVLPYSLREAARAQQIEPSRWPPAARQRSALAALARRYLLHGGFPEIQQANDFDRIQVLQDYVELVVLKDVVERHGVTNIVALRHLVRALLSANACAFSISRLHGALASSGVRVGKQTLLDYLEHVLDAQLCFTVSIRSRSEKQRAVNPRKVYAVDPGLASAHSSAGAVNLGALLENAVYLELRRRGGRLAQRAISYYRTSSGFEVDFAIDAVTPQAGRARPPRLVQVCATLADPKTRERELRALAEAMVELGCPEATIVTLEQEERIETQAGVVQVEPLWSWALRP